MQEQGNKGLLLLLSSVLSIAVSSITAIGYVRESERRLTQIEVKVEFILKRMEEKERTKTNYNLGKI